MIDHLRHSLELIAPGARKFALLAGAGLGWIAWELSRAPAQPRFGLAMALVMVLSGGASFVMGALALRVRVRPASRQVLAAEARTCIAWLGAGVAAGIHGLSLLG